MGIPVFFKTLITDYHKIVKPIDDIKIDNIFFDLNCLIHPCCAKVKDGNEELMIQTILDEIDKIILMTNSKFIYIAIDGPAPKAKMKQQKIRRLKSVLENKTWDTNAITPGTTFMNKLNEELHKKYNQPNIIISDSLEPGEGEHKILQYIKQKKDIFLNKINCIYGLDADLIMLALISGLRNIYLLRERTSFNIEQMEGEYLYLDIKELKKEIVSSFPGIPKQQIINDYIFICFFLGNDFIIHSPSLSLRYNGLHHVTEAYKHCQEKYNHKFYLINTKTKSLIHWNNLREYISVLESWENSIINETFQIRLKQHKKYKRIYDDIQRNKGNIKSSKNKLGYPSEDIMRHKPVIFMDNEKKIFQSDNWIQQYNLYTNTESFTMISVDELSKKVNNLCLKYIESLVWTTHYYFSQCISQEWYYPYEYSPTLHDVKIFLHKQKKVKIQLNTTPYTPIEQLRYIFPKQSYHLCDELEQVDENDFITKIDKEYTLLKRYDWECHPII